MWVKTVKLWLPGRIFTSHPLLAYSKILIKYKHHKVWIHNYITGYCSIWITCDDHLPVYPYIHPFDYLPVCPFVYPSILYPVCPSIHKSSCIWKFSVQSVCLFVNFVCSFLTQSTVHPFIQVSCCLNILLSISPSVYLLSLFVRLSIHPSYVLFCLVFQYSKYSLSNKVYKQQCF